jgi:dissimilatory sulfite reductase related protein
MNQKQIAGVVINVDEEGYLTDHAQWTRDVAVALAQEEGVELTPADWKVLEFIDKDFREKGVVPGMRRMNKIGGIATKDLYTLFPNGPIKKAARIAGYPKPVSCVKEADMISEERIKKVSIIVSRGSLDGVYPGLIMASGGGMEGIEANLFFTFFGLHAVLRQKMKHLKVATVGNPALCVPTAMGPGTPTWLGGIPGMS